MRSVVVRFTILASLLLGHAFAAQTPTFVFTAIPDQDETRLNERFSKVADYLHEKLGIKVKYVPVKSYPAAVTAFVNGQVQLAWFGGVTGVQARARVPGSTAIAQGAEDDHFKSYLIANASTGLKPEAAIPLSIAGKTLAFGARTSTSGSVMPEFYLRKAFGGKAPDKIFSRVGFTGDHSQTIQAVQSGAYQLGFVDYSVWDLDRKAGKVDDKKVSVIWQTPPFPDYQWTVRGDADAIFGAGFTKKLTQTLLVITDKDILSRFGRSKFIPSSNAQYAPVETVAKAAGLLD